MTRHFDRWRVSASVDGHDVGRTQSLGEPQARSVLALLTKLAAAAHLDTAIRWPTGWSPGGADSLK